MKKFNYLTFIVIFLAAFAFILYKALHIPMTHDEYPTTCIYYNFNVWQIMMYPDDSPNNHLLNTIITKGFILLFGKEQCVVRMPNVLSFLVYAFAIFRINKTVLKKDSIYFIPAALLFIANPYLIDFFSLCRGYGMSCAICTLSASYLISGYTEFKNKHIWLAFVFSILASYANFTLLVFWGATTMLAWFYFFVLYRSKQGNLLQPTLIIFISCIIYVALIAHPIFKMQSTNQFQFWNSAGFIKETLIPLIIHTFYGSKYKLFQMINTTTYLVIGVLIVNTIYILIKYKASHFQLKSLTRPVFVSTMIILLTAGINILQCIFMHTPNLTGRTALFFYPLFIIVLVTSIGVFSKLKGRIHKFVLASCISFICIFHLSTTLRRNNVWEWWFDENNLNVIAYLKTQSKGQQVSLKTNWLFHPSFSFYKCTDKTPWLDLKEYDKSMSIETDAEYYYILAEDYDMLGSKFEPIIKYDNNCWLLKRKDSF